MESLCKETGRGWRKRGFSVSFPPPASSILEMWNDPAPELHKIPCAPVPNLFSYPPSSSFPGGFVLFTVRIQSPSLSPNPQGCWQGLCATLPGLSAGNRKALYILTLASPCLGRTCRPVQKSRGSADCPKPLCSSVPHRVHAAELGRSRPVLHREYLCWRMV